MRLDVSSIIQTGETKTVDSEEVVKVLERYLRDYQMAREPLKDLWKDYYVSYLATPDAKRAILSRAARYVGDVNTNWRHSIKSPKAYEIVETIVSYMMGAFFPNERWFDLAPTMPIADPGWQQIVEINRRLMDKKLNDSLFRSAYRVFLRELCITGTSALMFPWKENNVRWKVLSPLEFLIDPAADYPNDANFIRTYSLHPAEFDEYRNDGTFNLAEKNADKLQYDYDNRRHFKLDDGILASIDTLMGIQRDTRTSQLKIDVFEFWGDLYLEDVILRNVRASWTKNGMLLNLDSNPYNEKPFIVGTYLRLSHSPYGVGALQPIASQLYYKDSLTSRTADNAAITSDTALEVVLDGVVDPDDVYMAPGKKIFTTREGVINPIALPNNSSASIQELNILEQTADKAVGTGPYIGVGQGRSGERVTAAEVQAQRDTGGKRLTDVFTDLEAEVLIPLLQRFHKYCQKFYQGGDVINFKGAYVSANPGVVQFADFEVKALGAANVADKEYNLRQLLDWMAVVGQNPLMAEMVNWEEVLKHLSYMMMPSIADNVISGPPAPQPQPMTPNQQLGGELEEAARFQGGEAGVRALQASQTAGALPAQMQNYVENLTR